MKVLRYTRNHLWIRFDIEDADNLPDKPIRAEIGATRYGIEQLSGIVYADMPQKGASFDIEDELCSLETTKTVYGVHSPFKGTVVESCEDVSLIDNDCMNVPLVIADCSDFAEMFDNEPDIQ